MIRSLGTLGDLPIFSVCQSYGSKEHRGQLQADAESALLLFSTAGEHRAIKALQNCALAMLNAQQPVSALGFALVALAMAPQELQLSLIHI